MKIATSSPEPSHRFPWEELLFAVVVGLPAASLALLIGLAVASDVSGGHYGVVITNDTKGTIIFDAIVRGGTPTVGAFIVGIGFGAVAAYAGVRLWKASDYWRAGPKER